jgi:hypothetical protein
MHKFSYLFILYTLIPSAYASGTEASTEHMRQELMLKKVRGWNFNILQEWLEPLLVLNFQDKPLRIFWNHYISRCLGEQILLLKSLIDSKDNLYVFVIFVRHIILSTVHYFILKY